MSILLILALATPLPALADGGGGSGGGSGGKSGVGSGSSNDDAPPTPTQTSSDCTDGQMWDQRQSFCIDPEDDGTDNDARFAAARERGLAVHNSMTEGNSDRVLTYRGFVLHKAGRLRESLAACDLAPTQNPDNILARSYLGMDRSKWANLPVPKFNSQRFVPAVAPGPGPNWLWLWRSGRERP